MTGTEKTIGRWVYSLSMRRVGSRFFLCPPPPAARCSAETTLVHAQAEADAEEAPKPDPEPEPDPEPVVIEVKRKKKKNLKKLLAERDAEDAMKAMGYGRMVSRLSRKPHWRSYV